MRETIEINGEETRHVAYLNSTIKDQIFNERESIGRDNFFNNETPEFKAII